MNFAHSIRLMTILSAAAATTLSTFADEQRSRAPGGPAAVQEAKVDLNTADVKTLAAVPAIGIEVADKIVAARPFATIDELDRVKGLTAEQLEQIRAKVTVAAAHVPAKLGEPAAGASRQPSTSAGGGNSAGRKKVDLNTADLETLATIPGIGPDAARAIIAARPFTSVDGLSRVKGISAEQLELIRANVVVGRPPGATKQPRATP